MAVQRATLSPGLRLTLRFSQRHMDTLSLCWRGMAGTGKRTRLQAALRDLADLRKLPFTIQMRPLALGTGGAMGDVAEAGATEDGAGPDDEGAGQFMFESSLVHIGLDIARMSMQDKHILRPVLMRLGQGSQVMAGDQGRGARILVLYHAHLLSSESVLLLQACLEQNEGDLSIWITSELPVPQRVRDWFVEVPVAGEDYAFQAFQRAAVAAGVSGPVSHWPTVFRAMIDRWRAAPPPKLQEVKEVKALVYEMLMRNLRWVEATHFLLDVLLSHTEITAGQRRAAMAALASCEATGGGYTIPSYRIPILWESLFLQLRTIFALPETDGTSNPPGPKRATRQRKRAAAPGVTV